MEPRRFKGSLTRLRSVVLRPLLPALPASLLLRLVNAPTLLPMLLLKTPLLPELDMTASICVLVFERKIGIEVNAEESRLGMSKCIELVDVGLLMRVR